MCSHKTLRSLKEVKIKKIDSHHATLQMCQEIVRFCFLVTLPFLSLCVTLG